MTFTVSLFIFILTLVSIIFRPFKKKEYIYTMFFAVLSFFVGTAKIDDAYYVLNNIWNAVFSLISIMIISLILDEVGFFKWAALTMALTSEGKGKRLFIHTIFLGALITIFFNNDGSILILTPIVYEMVEALGFTKKSMLPFLFACGLIADTASVPLVVSNLANIVNSDLLGMSFNYYLSKMLVPGLAAIFLVSITMYLVFRKDIQINFDTSRLQNPDEEVKDWGIFNAGIWVLFLVIIGYFGASYIRIPVSFVSISGAIFLLLYTIKRGTINQAKILRNAPWGIILFAFGMYIVVYSLYRNGLNQYIDKIIIVLSKGNKIKAALGGGLFSTLSACTMNNLPSTMIGAFAIDNSTVNASVKEILAFSSIIGNDIGAKLTPVGSLATILWMDIIRAKGAEISWWEYIKNSFLVISVVLILTLVLVGTIV